MKLMEGELTRGVGILLSCFKTNKEKDEYLHMYLKKMGYAGMTHGRTPTPSFKVFSTTTGFHL